MLTVKLRERIFAVLECLPEQHKQLIYEYSLLDSKIRIVIDRTDFFFMQLPQGKPDPLAPCGVTTSQNDERGRVKQAKSKGACSIYALKRLAFRVGKRPSKAMAEPRRKEKLCSDRRKKISELTQSLQGILDFRSPSPELLKTKELTRHAVSLLVNNPKMMTDKAWLPFYIDFLNSKFKNFYEYAVDKVFTSFDRINKCFLQEAGYDPKVIYEAFPDSAKNPLYELLEREKVSDTSLRWESLPFKMKSVLTDTYCITATAELLNLQKSTWRPASGINALIVELKEKGPMVVSGIFGQPAYSERPFKMVRSPIFGFEIYQWNPRARLAIPHYAHSITIVGAMKDSFGLIEDKKDSQGEYVFYVDPNDGSDPKDPSVQKIYITSFNTLCQNIFPINAFWNLQLLIYPKTFFGWVMKS